jgi:hypothetical protein
MQQWVLSIRYHTVQRHTDSRVAQAV